MNTGQPYDNDLQRTTLVVGLGKSGVATLRFLAAHGVALQAADSRLQPPGLEAIQTAFPELPISLGPLDEKLLCSVERIVLSPGISLWDPEIQQAEDAGVEVVGDVELFARLCPSPVIAITGSNGKSTVTTLVAEMAAEAGIRVAAGGNLGTPVLELLQQAADLYVVELSSFQLETTESLQAVAAVVLNVSPDHMDRYRDLQHYAETKGKIYHHAVHRIVPLDEHWVQEWVEQQGYGEGEQISYGAVEPVDQQSYGLCQHQGGTWFCKGDEYLLPVDALRIAGRHNQSNALAALALGEAAGIPLQPMLETLKRFSGLPHRTEWVAEERQLRWINDSKGTNVGAAEAAIEGLSDGVGKIVWIGGGQGKGADFSPLRELAQRHMRAAVVMGEDRQQIADVIAEAVPVVEVESMDAAVDVAAAKAEPGDTILLSPACASFDQFSGFEARGNAFKAAVQQWLESCS